MICIDLANVLFRQVKVDWRFPMFSTEEIPVTSFEDENSHEENYATPSWEPTVEVTKYKHVTEASHFPRE